MNTARSVLLASFLAIGSVFSPAGATSFTTDQSDLWYIASESGWGIQFVQRGSVIFATMFVYDQSGTPIWYVATMRSSGNYMWTGDLLRTQGPWFGTAPFDPNTVTFRKVGTMTWKASATSTGVLTYSVDGVAVSKNLTRQLLVLDDFSGRYAGGMHQTLTGCADSSLDATNDQFAFLTVTQNAASVTMSTSTSNITCTFSGNLSQAGQMGDVTGNYTCSSGDFGGFEIFEMQVNISGLTGRLSASSVATGCSTSGWFGGMRGTTF